MAGLVTERISYPRCRGANIVWDAATPSAIARLRPAREVSTLASGAGFDAFWRLEKWGRRARIRRGHDAEMVARKPGKTGEGRLRPS